MGYAAIVAAFGVLVTSSAFAEVATFRDCADCPEMVTIPAGSFRMGSPLDEAERSKDEGPLRQVALRSFALGKYEVTVGEYRPFVREAGISWPGNCPIHFRQDDRHPAVCVKWSDARAYVAWLGRKTGQRYRLPTEAEWEYAARAGTTTPFHFGSAITEGLANIGVGGKRGGTTRVGAFAANAFGLHDVHGNVWEWVEDCYADSYAGAPADGRAVLSGPCENRVLRGGSWYANATGARIAFRNWDEIGVLGNDLGFRVARSVTAP